MNAEHWSRHDDADLKEIWEALPLPWPDGALRSWLRYADRQIRRGRAPWLPARAPVQLVKVVSSLRLPGRDGLHTLSGISARRCDTIARGWVDWQDTFPATEEERSGGVRPPIGQRSGSDRADDTKDDVEPAPVIGQRSGSDRAAIGQRSASRASTDPARAIQEQVQEQVQRSDPDLDLPLKGERDQTSVGEGSPRGTPEPAQRRGQQALLAPPAPVEDLDPEDKATVDLYERMLRGLLATPKCPWPTPDWAAERRWFVEAVIDGYPTVNVRNELHAAEAWLHGQMLDVQRGKKGKVPKLLHIFLLNWMKRARTGPPSRAPDRDRDPAYQGVPEGFEPTREYRHVAIIDGRSRPDPDHEPTPF